MWKFSPFWFFQKENPSDFRFFSARSGITWPAIWRGECRRPWTGKGGLGMVDFQFFGFLVAFARQGYIIFRWVHFSIGGFVGQLHTGWGLRIGNQYGRVALRNRVSEKVSVLRSLWKIKLSLPGASNYPCFWEAQNRPLYYIWKKTKKIKKAASSIAVGFEKMPSSTLSTEGQKCVVSRGKDQQGRPAMRGLSLESTEYRK